MPTGKAGGILSVCFKIQKSENEKRLAFGWANISATPAGDQVEVVPA